MRHNEKVKLFANYMNGCAIAFFAVGCLGVAGSMLLSMEPVTYEKGLAYAVFFFWRVGSLAPCGSPGIERTEGVIEAMILMSLVVALVAIPALASAALAEDGLYVPTVHILNTKGGFETLILAGFENGVSRTECEMRLEAWDKEMNFTETIDVLKAQGQSASIRLECEPK